MRELTEAAGLPVPEFESRAGEVVVRFHPAPRTGHTTKGKHKEQLESLEPRILALGI